MDYVHRPEPVSRIIVGAVCRWGADLPEYDPLWRVLCGETMVRNEAIGVGDNTVGGNAGVDSS